MENLKLSIDNEIFEGLKENFDKILKKTISDMEDKDTANAKVTLNLFIELFRQKAVDEEGQEYYEVYPTFKYETSSVMQTKCKIAGAMTDECVLAWNEDDNEYVLQKAYDPQMTIGECVEEDEYYIYNEEDDNSNDEEELEDETPVDIDEIFEDDEGEDEYEYDEEEEEINA